MPSAPPRPCRHPGCGALVRDGSSYCTAHKKAKEVVHGSFADRSRGTRHQRGYGSAWDRLRLHILERDCGLCRVCSEAGRITPAAQVDHIVPKAWGGTDDESNLQAICRTCHTAKTNHEKTQWRREGGVKKV